MQACKHGPRVVQVVNIHNKLHDKLSCRIDDTFHRRLLNRHLQGSRSRVGLKGPFIRLRGMWTRQRRTPQLSVSSRSTAMKPQEQN